MSKASQSNNEPTTPGTSEDETLRQAPATRSSDETGDEHYVQVGGSDLPLPHRGMSFLHSDETEEDPYAQTGDSELPLKAAPQDDHAVGRRD